MFFFDVAVGVGIVVNVVIVVDHWLCLNDAQQKLKAYVWSF